MLTREGGEKPWACPPAPGVAALASFPFASATAKRARIRELSGSRRHPGRASRRHGRCVFHGHDARRIVEQHDRIATAIDGDRTHRTSARRIAESAQHGIRAGRHQRAGAACATLERRAVGDHVAVNEWNAGGTRRLPARCDAGSEPRWHGTVADGVRARRGYLAIPGGGRGQLGGIGPDGIRAGSAHRGKHSRLVTVRSVDRQ
jgi:hypothetical protein